MRYPLDYTPVDPVGSDLRMGVGGGGPATRPRGRSGTIIPATVRLGVLMLPLVVLAEPIVTLPPLSTCVAIPGFAWATFVDHISAANVVATLSDLTNDNVTLNVKLSPLARYKQAAGGTNIAGTFGFTATTFRTLAAKLTHNQPDYRSAPLDNLLAVPPRDYLLSKRINGFELDPSIADADGNIVVPGLPGVGQNGLEFQAQATNEPIAFEMFFTRNTASANTSKGYSGFTWFGDLTSSTDFAAPFPGIVIDEFRKGIIDVDRAIDDPAFDIAWMRAGLIVKRNGAVYDISLVYNGAVWQSATLPSSGGVDNIGWLPRTFFFGGSEEFDVADGYIGFYEDFGTQVRTSTDLWQADSDFGTYPPQAASMGCVKLGLYIKPSVGNTTQFSSDVLFYPITDPAYPLP